MFRKGIYISSVKQDSKWLRELQTFLRPHTRDENIELYSNENILPGANRKQEIATGLNKCRVAVLLLSADYLAEDELIKNELPLILAEQGTGELIVFTVFTGHAAYEAAGFGKFPQAHDPSIPLNSMDKPEREKTWVEITRQIVHALDINAIGNMFRIIDEFMPRQQAYIENRAPDDTLPVYSVVARQEETRIALVRRGADVFETITGADLDKLDPDSLLLIRTYEASMKILFERWIQLQPHSYAADPQEREEARNEMDVLRKDLCMQLNRIIDFLRKMHKYLDDHYHHVRYICSQ